MRKFKIVLEGKDAVMEVDGIATRCGFFTTRFVSARSVEDAEAKAIALVRDELASTISSREATTVRIIVDRVDEIDSFEGCPVPGEGFTFYKEDD